MPAKLPEGRPYIICHMLGSVDGRIQSGRWPGIDGAALFETYGDKIRADGWIVGRKTMSEFSSRKPRARRKGTFRVPKTDFVAPPVLDKKGTKTYAVGLDPDGRLSWDSGMVDTEHVVTVLTERVSAEYLDYLKSRGVSYIFGGKTALDLHRVARKLRTVFGIKRIMVQGGGGNNGSWLKAGLIDEVSLLLAPVADGSTGTPTLFDAAPGTQKSSARRLTLSTVRRLPGGVLWLRYRVEN